MSSFTGAAIGFLIFSAVAYVYSIVKKREGLGGGDIMLLTAIGALTGPLGVFFTLFFSSLLALLANLPNAIQKKGTAFAYGPYLIIASYLYVLVGTPIINWYVHLIVGGS